MLHQYFVWPTHSQAAKRREHEFRFKENKKHPSFMISLS